MDTAALNSAMHESFALLKETNDILKEVLEHTATGENGTDPALRHYRYLVRLAQTNVQQLMSRAKLHVQQVREILNGSTGAQPLPFSHGPAPTRYAAPSVS
jgi:hypothetical protein